MEPLQLVLSLVGNVVNRLWPDKTQQEKQQFILALQQELNQTDLARSQIAVNEAEAANPNRRWVTWRELTGYACASAVIWSYILQPFLLFILAAANHPVTNLPELDMGQLMFLLLGMLGIGGMKTYEKVKGVRK